MSNKENKENKVNNSKTCKPNTKGAWTGRKKDQKQTKGGKPYSTNDNAYVTDARQHGSDKINDWSWYAPDEAMLKQAGSISFFTPQGTEMSLSSYGKDANIGHRSFDYVVPGLLNVRYFNTIGKCTDASSPANVAANLVYTFVRHMNSGSKNYESSDLMLYLLAMDDIYTHIAQIGKLLGVARNWHSTNKYMPRAIFDAVGVNYQDTVDNLADYYFKLNVLTSKCKYFNVPKIFPIYKRHLWLVSNVFKDGPDTKSCIINMHNYILHQYSAKTNEKGGELVPLQIYPVDGMNFKLSTIMSSIDATIGTLLADEDIGIMSGDIKKAYGENLFVPGFYSADEVIEPFFSNELLDSLQNMVIPFTVSQNRMTTYDQIAKITQSGNTLHDGVVDAVNAMLEGDTFGGLEKCILNSFMEEPDAIQNMLSTRFTVLIRVVNEANKKVDVTYGTEFVMGMNLYELHEGDIVPSRPFGTVLNNYTTEDNRLASLEASTGLATISRHPTLYVRTRTGNSPNYVYPTYIEGDFENTTVLDYNTLSKLHTCATLGEFNIPN